MDYIDFKNIYWNYYMQLEKQFFDTMPYCTIDNDNDNAFSINYLQMHLSICSEIDSIFKLFCKSLDDSLDNKKCNIANYKRIITEKYPTFANEIVTLEGYKYKNVSPWESISTGDSPEWWVIYNGLKHNRSDINNGKENYKMACQKTVIEALCGLYVLLEYWTAYNIISKEEDTSKLMIIFKSKYLTLKNWNSFYSYFMSGGNCWFDNKRFFKYINEGEKQ